MLPGLMVPEAGAELGGDHVVGDNRRAGKSGGVLVEDQGEGRMR